MFFPIHVPALRERGEDVVHIAEFMLRHMAIKFGKPSISLTKPIKERFKQGYWKGNVRELQNVLERAVILSARGKVDWNLILPEQDASENNSYVAENRIFTQKRASVFRKGEYP